VLRRYLLVVIISLSPTWAAFAGCNDPVAVADNLDNYRATLVVEVLANDRDADGDALAVDLAWDRLFLAIALWNQDRAPAKKEARQGLAILDPALGRDNPKLHDLITEMPKLSPPPESKPKRAKAESNEI
jgi:hypothetical protein